VTKPTFYASLHELEDGPKELSGAIPDDWLRSILTDTDVEPTGTNDGRLDLVLTKNGLDVLVQGRLSVNVTVPCARTLDPAVYQVRPEVFLLLVPSAKRLASLAEERPRHKRSKVRGDTTKTTAPAKTGGKSAAGWENDPVLSDQDAAQDTYSGDQIVLDHFLREFILLEVPMIPLREDLRGTPFEANPPLPGTDGNRSTAPATPSGSADKPLDPRFSALAELKAQLEKKE
jgi:uncharacterized metal-binding protein YceD (DUF177 family)